MFAVVKSEGDERGGRGKGDCVSFRCDCDL